MKNPELHQRVMNDVAQAQEDDVQAVPTFFLNGHKMQPAPATADAFFALIDSELNNR